MTRNRSRLGTLIVIGMLGSLLPLTALPAGATTGDLVITGVVDGPLAGGLPKAIELYVANDIPDLSIYGVDLQATARAPTGRSSPSPRFRPLQVTSCIWPARPRLHQLLRLRPRLHQRHAPSLNGDDAVELFMNGAVVDVFGERATRAGALRGTTRTAGPTEPTAQVRMRPPSRRPIGHSAASTPSMGRLPTPRRQHPFPLGTYTEETSPPPPSDSLILNEVDADTPGTDAAEFVEIYDGGTGNTSLDGFALVFYNGSNDLSYGSVDLDGLTTDSDGYAVVCGDVDAAFAVNCDLDAAVGIQNGQDAVALYAADGADFPGNSPVTLDGLVDAVVHETADPDDPGLLALLNANQPQVDENAAGDGPGHSNQRCPNGSGGARNTGSYAQFIPTVGVANVCAVVPPDPVARLIHEIQGAGPASPHDGSGVVVEAVVVGDFQGAGALRGFYRAGGGLAGGQRSVDLRGHLRLRRLVRRRRRHW